MSDEKKSCCGDDQCGVDRRGFLTVAGLGIISAAASAARVEAGPASGRRESGALRVEGSGSCGQPAGPAISHFVPVDKKLAAEWVAALTQRGMPTISRGAELSNIGMPVGGVAAGQVYLRGDGTLGCWQVFNEEYFSGWGATNYQASRAIEAPVANEFLVIVEDASGGSGVKGRSLARSGFETIEFEGQYPIGVVRYQDAAFPVTVELEAFSPFVPMSADDSSLPATVLHYTVRNDGSAAVRVRLTGSLANAVGAVHAAGIEANRRTRIVKENGRVLAIHSMEAAVGAGEAAPDRPTIVLAEFEGTSYGDWVATGSALGAGPAHGTLPNQNPVSGFEGEGLVNTFREGDQTHGTLTSPTFTVARTFLNFLIGGGAHPGDTCINLLVNGKVVRTATGRNEERLRWRSWEVSGFEGEEANLIVMDTHSGGWGHINIDQIEMSDEARHEDLGPIDRLTDFGTMVLAYAATVSGGGEDGATGEIVWVKPGEGRARDLTVPVIEAIGGMVSSEWVELPVGAAHTFTFVAAWHFPIRADVGQHYATRFADAAAVAHYVLDHHERLTNDTRLWRDTFYRDSTLPMWLLERLHSTVGNLATGTCQRWASGRFWAWEGVGCCHGTCTHVWNYAQAMGRLFPALERSVREMQDLGVAFHDDTGLVGFRGEPNGAQAADGQTGTVLKCYREHLMSGDDAFLRRNWPHIRQVLEFSIGQDGDDDGLIEGSQHNTYDINFEGPNTFVGSLYLAAIRAGQRMAVLMGDLDFAQRLEKIFDVGRERTAARLFNGEYFIQDVDLEAAPRDQYGPGCLSDQLFGQGWAHHVGLGYLYPREAVRSALRAIWKYNWAPDIGPQNKVHVPERWFATPGEAGLFTCTWPTSRYLTEGVRYREEVWTGIEYQVAGHMIWEGMVTEGLAIVRAIHERYYASKRNPFNEVECGDHYARALASWGVYHALLGFECDGPAGILGFDPQISAENFAASFTAAEGWGLFSQVRAGAGADGGGAGEEGGGAVVSQMNRIDVRWGVLAGLRLIRLSVPESLKGKPVSVMVNDLRPAVLPSARYDDAGDRVAIEFAEPGLRLEAGQSLQVSIG